MEKLRIALAQINPIVGDLKGNAAKIASFIEYAKGYKANIVAFPELSLCGYPPEDLLLKEHFVKDNLEELNSLREKTSGIIAVIGFVDKDKKGNLYNAAAIIQNCKLKGVYHKIELPNYGVFDEKRYFKAGDIPYAFALENIKFAVNICEDIWIEDGVYQRQADMGSSVIINISASPYHIGKRELKIKMLKKRTQQTKAYICYLNLLGGQDELVFDGGSLVLDPRGNIIARAEQFKEDLLVSDILIKSKKKSKSKYCISLANIVDARKPNLPKRKIKILDSISEIYSALVLGTQDYIRKNGFKKVVIGLSGGIDSSIVATIACDAIGRENVVGISMPSVYSSEETQSDAKLLAQNLGIKFIVVPIQSIFETYLSSLKDEFHGTKTNVTEENLQARIRGNILMSFSNKFGWLVLNTGNKSETSVGYCTLYGDMAGGFSVIKDVGKTLVYKLARVANSKDNRKVIPESVFEREPTAELRVGQKDSDTLPKYDILDKVLKRYVEENKSVKEIVSLTKIDLATVKEVVQKVDTNEYKRRQAPPGIKITPLAFGKDRRMPITNLYKER